jgi:hypothetical protein
VRLAGDFRAEGTRKINLIQIRRVGDGKSFLLLFPKKKSLRGQLFSFFKKQME